MWTDVHLLHHVWFKIKFKVDTFFSKYFSFCGKNPEHGPSKIWIPIWIAHKNIFIREGVKVEKKVTTGSGKTVKESLCGGGENHYREDLDLIEGFDRTSNLFIIDLIQPSQLTSSSSSSRSRSELELYSYLPIYPVQCKPTTTNTHHPPPH